MNPFVTRVSYELCYLHTQEGVPHDGTFSLV